MPIIVNTGRVAMVEALIGRPCHIAWGTGDGAWTTPPAESNFTTALMNEVGRRKVTNMQYVTPDVSGTIVVPNGKFSLAGSPTNHLYIQCDFDFTDAPSSVIREIGVFFGCTTNPGLPGGQLYFVPADIVTPGTLFHLEYIQPIFRSPAIQEAVKIVTTL